MKFSLVLLSAIAATSSAFVAQQPVAFRSTQLNANAKAAASPEDDLEKTRDVINQFMNKQMGIAEPEPAAAAPPAAPAKEKKAKKAKAKAPAPDQE